MTNITVGGTWLPLTSALVGSILLTIFYSAMIILLVICLVLAVWQIHKTVKARKQMQKVDQQRQSP